MEDRDTHLAVLVDYTQTRANGLWSEVLSQWPWLALLGFLTAYVQLSNQAIDSLGASLGWSHLLFGCHIGVMNFISGGLLG